MQTPTPFSFDGHGINDAQGQRIAKVSSCEPYTYETGQPQRNAEFDQLSNLFATAPELLKELEYTAQVLTEACDCGNCEPCRKLPGIYATISKAKGKK